jgi:hypothetical protein
MVVFGESLDMFMLNIVAAGRWTLPSDSYSSVKETAGG